MTTNKIWHAVYTRPQWEKKVSRLLLRRNIECYCPMNRSVHQWADRKKIIDKPLFGSYVFVHVDATEHLLIKQTDGILNFVYWLGKPAVIRDEEIDTIKTFLKEHENVQVEKAHVSVSDKIRIMDGPLIYMEGKVMEIKNQTVKVYLPSLGCSMSAEVHKGSVEIIRKHNPSLNKTA